MMTTSNGDVNNLTVPAKKTSQITQPLQHSTRFFSTLPPYRRDHFVCTSCGGHSTGGIYSSVCNQCNGIISDPPRNARHHYLCTNCAQYRTVCTCDRSPVIVTNNYTFRNPPKYCWCKCCTCCTYSCSCLYCRYFCECLSAPCKRYEPCCYCTRLCCPKQTCCKTRLCFWSWCPCFCSQP